MDIQKAPDAVTPQQLVQLLSSITEMHNDPNMGIDKPREICWWFLVDLVKQYVNFHNKQPTKVFLPKAYEAALAKPVIDRTGGIPLREMTKLLGMELTLNAASFRIE